MRKEKERKGKERKGKERISIWIERIEESRNYYDLRHGACLACVACLIMHAVTSIVMLQFFTTKSFTMTIKIGVEDRGDLNEGRTMIYDYRSAVEVS